jgi:hypothetical protein
MFIPCEFRDLGSEDQVLRVLRGLVREKRLVRLGYSIYGRAVGFASRGRTSSLQPKRVSPRRPQALTKLGVSWEPTEAERAA